MPLRLAVYHLGVMLECLFDSLERVDCGDDNPIPSGCNFAGAGARCNCRATGPENLAQGALHLTLAALFILTVGFLGLTFGVYGSGAALHTTDLPLAMAQCLHVPVAGNDFVEQA